MQEIFIDGVLLIVFKETLPVLSFFFFLDFFLFNLPGGRKKNS
jgi:hypothetical protein